MTRSKQIFNLSLIIGLLLLLSACYHKPTFNQAHAFFKLGQYRNAFKQFEALGLRGDARAAYTVGYLYYYGIGVQEDEDMARSWVRVAARKGYQPAVYAMDVLLKSGPDPKLPAQTPTPPMPHPRAVYPDQDIPDVAWLRQQPPEFYTVHILDTHDPGEIAQICEHKLSYNHHRVTKYHFKHHKKMNYGLVYGSFETYAAADRARERLAIGIRKTSEIVQFKTIQVVMLPD